jgi:hypothetical protein
MARNNSCENAALICAGSDARCMVAVTLAKLGGENAGHFLGRLLFNSRGFAK